jgi:predicted RNase H-like nuclease (RuvC/YqgF family)
MRWFDVEDAERAEQEAYEKQMQTMYDEQRRMQELTEEAEWLHGEVKRLKEENEELRGERAAVVAGLRAAANAEHPIERGVPSLSPAGRGLLLLHADRIERGEHRREETP